MFAVKVGRYESDYGGGRQKNHNQKHFHVALSVPDMLETAVPANVDNVRAAPVLSVRRHTHRGVRTDGIRAAAHRRCALFARTVSA